MTSDDWFTAALTDEELVAELLLRLKHSPASYLSPAANLLPFCWGHKQPRSRLPTRKEKERELTRCSPTTPLSWSAGAASTSDGYDESSWLHPHRSSTDRSKGTFTNENTTTTNNKRSRRKKTFSELKEEESLLLNERIHLKKELVTLCITLEEQRAQSDKLKRIKLDMQLQAANKMGTISHEPEGAISTQHNLIEASARDHFPLLPTHAAADSCKDQSGIDTWESGFILPDLNMTPAEDDFDSQTLYGMMS
ncbi:uncharacterized protein LOC132284498 [Cornus florida]|uniref:uncharacterized protein LOC132284498 n=1 Tax=Cornus florida TaxID=4283 RepID=UPI0028A285B9|nr:uncharacterized protein LOC132284498 [Cornus florida]